MGCFSWCTSDSHKSIPGVVNAYGGAPTTVYLLNPFGESYKESDYEGYGKFGGRDVYELVVEWNKSYLSEANLRKPLCSDYSADQTGASYFKRAFENYTKKCAAIKEYAAGATDEYMREHYGTLFGFGDGSDWKRCLGIDIACYDEQHVKLRYPIKIVEKNCSYEDASISPQCPFQGCFYDMSHKAMSKKIINTFNDLLVAEKAYAVEKADALTLAFSRMKMDDVFVAENYPQLIVRDDDGNCWTDGKVYDFVLNECLGFESDGTVQFGFGAVSQDLADILKSHALSHGVFPKQIQKSVDEKIFEAAAIKEKTAQNNEKNHKIER